MSVSRAGYHLGMATRASVKNEKQYDTLKDKGMSKERAAKIANSPRRNGGKAAAKTS